MDSGLWSFFGIIFFVMVLPFLIAAVMDLKGYTSKHIGYMLIWYGFIGTFIGVLTTIPIWIGG